METLCSNSVILTYIVQWRDMDMKRLFSILLITAMLVALTPMMGTVALAEEYATVTSENGYGVRLREGPSKAYGVIRLYGVGTTAVVLQSGAEWSQLKIGSTVGWMQNKYLNFGTTGSGYVGSTITGLGTVYVTSGNGLRVWLRSAPGGSRIDLYSPGTPVTLIEYGETWCYVAIDGTLGYMMREFLAKAPDGSDGTSSGEGAVSGKIESVAINYPYPVVGDVMEAKIEPEGASVKYSWKVDGVELGTEPTFSVLSRYTGKLISLTVTGIDGCYGTATDTAEALVQISRGMKSVKLDTLAPVVGDVIGAILQPSSASVEYYWRVAGVEVSNDPTYTVQESDIGKLIQLKVVGVGGYEGSVACSAEAYVTSDKELKYVELTDYYPLVGEGVSAYVEPADADVEYSWTIDGEVVSTEAYYNVGRLDLGKELHLTVKGVDPYTGSVSAATKKISSQEITGVSISGADAPVVGDVLYARLTPSTATATYMWYDGEFNPDDLTENRVGVGASLVVKSTMVDKQLMVRAEGSGIYSAVVFSDWTEPVIDDKKITSVTLDNTYPVVGDTLTATPYPTPEDEALIPAFRDAQTYVWMIDTEVAPNHDAYYTVKASDVGKVIRVKVTGSNGYIGEAYSLYTNPVVENTVLAGVAIMNKTKDASALSASPDLGDVLEAVIDPPQATADYKWYVNNSLKAVGPTYTIPHDSAFAGAEIAVIATGTGNYQGEVIGGTAPVSALYSLTATVNVANPEAGMPPVYAPSFKVDDVNYGGSINWLFSRNPDVQAELDRHGHYLPDTTYIAAITLDMPAGYTLANSTITVPGASSVVIDKATGVIYATFQTAKQQITDYYIAELPRPVEGAVPVTAFETDQYTATVSWDAAGLNGTVFGAAAEYEATITITGIDEYVTGGVAQDVFSVSTADITKSTANPTAGTNTPITVTAIFKSQDPYVTVTADKTDVYLDGYNSRLVQCLFDAENYIGDPSTIPTKWEIIDAVVDGTSINGDGQLTIGMYETADRVIRVRVWGDLDADGVRDEKEEATIGINLISGTDMDTAIKVEFTKAPVQIAKGSKAEFDVKVSNSSKGFLLYVFAPTATDITTTMEYTVPASTTEKQFVVKAFSVEDPSVVASIVVKIHDSESIIPKTADDELLLEDEMIILDDAVVEEEAVAEEPVEEEAVVEEIPAEETPAVEEETAEEVPAEPVIEIVEPTEETPAVEEETAEEVPAEPVIEIVEPTEETPAVEEETAEEVPAEPVIEIVEPTEETPAVEEENAEEVPAEPTIEIVITAEEEPAVEEETPDTVVIEIKDTVTGEVVEAEETEEPVVEETVAEEPVAEETEEELTGVVIAIKDTVTGEVFEEKAVEEVAAEEEVVEEKKSSKKTETKAEEASEEVVEEEIDPELDDLEGDKDVGESAAESLIKIRFVEMVSEIKRGHTAVFSVETEGTEQGVVWSVRLSKNAEGKKVSSIGQDGLLVVSGDETAEKLVVVATSAEDNTVRARWIVKVVNPSAKSTKKTSTEAVEEEVLTEEVIIEESVEQPVVEETVEEEVEVERESEGLSDEQLQLIMQELEALEQENAVLDNF